jgi:hypothetical protein
MYTWQVFLKPKLAPVGGYPFKKKPGKFGESRISVCLIYAKAIQ